MFTKLFALLFGRKKPDPVLTLDQRMSTIYEKHPERFARSFRPAGKASQARNSQPDDLLSNPFNPLNPIGFNSPVFYDSDTSSTNSSCSSSSSSSYDSGSSCDSGSSSSSGGD